MAGTTLQDVIVPELFNPYVINRTMELSALVQSGIIVNNTEFDALASQASPMVNMPFFEDLTGESEQVIEGTDLNDNKITSNKDVAVILRRAKMWSATDLSAALAGTDPMMAIASLVARFWERDMQKELIAILKGVFGTVPAGSSGDPAGFVPTETDRAKRKGSGVDYLINRKTMILHPRGIAWQNAEVAKTEGPSRTEVAIPKNWKPVYEPKQIRIVAFKHKLG